MSLKQVIKKFIPKSILEQRRYNLIQKEIKREKNEVNPKSWTEKSERLEGFLL